MRKAKELFDIVILGTALAFALVIGNSAMAIGGIILVMLSDRIGGQKV